MGPYIRQARRKVTGAQGWPNGGPRRKQTARIPTFKFEKSPGSVPQVGMAGDATPAQVESFLGVDVATHDERRRPGNGRLENLARAGIKA
jgi:hypothetical protein